MNKRILTPLMLGIGMTLPLCAGCGGSGSRSGSTTAAPTTTQSATPLPDPGGVVAPLVTSTSPAVAQLQTNVYVAFKEQVSVSDLVLPSEPALRDRAFVVEDDGTLRVLDISGPTPQLDRSFGLFSGPLQPGVATGKLTLQGPNLALVTTSGSGGEGVALFDPVSATSDQDVTWFNLNAVTTTWPAGTLNSQGVDVGGQARPLSYTSDAVVAGGKLIWTSSNLDASFDNDPGTLTAFDIDLTTRTLSGSGAIQQTSDFNPTGLTLLPTPQGDLLLCTNTGVFAQVGASIDLLDPVTLRKVGTIPVTGPANPVGRVVVSPDGKRGYLASQSQAQVFVLDLDGVGAELSNQSVAQLPNRFRGGYTLPSPAGTNFVSSIALSHTGNYLYAVSFNESALYAIDLTRPDVAARVVGFQRSANPANYEGLCNTVAVRPGVPGVDFSGPSVFALTINLAAADQTVTNVKVALDAVTLDRH